MEWGGWGLRGSACQTRGFTVLVFRMWWQAGPGALCRMWGKQQSTGHKERQAGKWSASAWTSPSSPSWSLHNHHQDAAVKGKPLPRTSSPQAQPWCLEDALCSFMSLESPTGSCLPHGIPWPSTPSSQSHEENVMCFPMNPATPVPRTGMTGELDPHHNHTCAKNSHSGGARPSPEPHLCQEQA